MALMSVIDTKHERSWEMQKGIKTIILAASTALALAAGSFALPSIAAAHGGGGGGHGGGGGGFHGGSAHFGGGFNGGGFNGGMRTGRSVGFGHEGRGFRRGRHGFFGYGYECDSGYFADGYCDPYNTY